MNSKKYIDFNQRNDIFIDYYLEKNLKKIAPKDDLFVAFMLTKKSLTTIADFIKDA